MLPIGMWIALCLFMSALLLCFDAGAASSVSNLVSVCTPGIENTAAELDMHVLMTAKAQNQVMDGVPSAYRWGTGRP
jgi:hypothetical protein